MSGRKVVIKMRNLKKRFANNEMLYLAIILSLLRTDPDSLMSGLGSSNNQSGGGNDLYDSADQPFGDMWIQTQSHQDSFGFGLGGNDLSPRLHPKNYESMLERFHSEILDDLNNLGRYDRIRPCFGQPVEINAYVLNADQEQPDPNDGNNPDPRSSSPHHGESDHDSGISDTEAQMSSPSDSEDLEEIAYNPSIEAINAEDGDEMSDRAISRVSPMILDQDDTLDLDLGFAANPFDVLGAPDVNLSEDFIPDEEDVVNQLIHIDDQLNYIDENLDEISDEFLHLDEQLAVHLQEEQVVTGSVGPDGASDDINVDLDEDLLLTEVDFAAQPFDDWLLDADRSLEEFAHLSDDVFTKGEHEKKPESGDYKASQALKTASTASANSSFKPNGDQKNEFPPAANGFLSSAGSSLESSPRSRNNSAPLTTNPNASSHPGPSNTQTVASPHGPNEPTPVPSVSNDTPSAATSWLGNGDGKYEQSSLEDLLRTSHPEGLLRNVSLHQGFNQAHGLNDSFPIPGSGDQSSNTDLAFGASSLANLTNTANVQTTVEAQSSGEAPFGITDTEIIKEIFNVFGGRDLHEVENWGASVDGSSASSSSANPGNGSSLSTSNGRQQHRNDLSQASSTSTNDQGTIRHGSLAEDPYSNGSVTPTFDNGSMTPSPYAAAMLSAATIPGYSGYNPYLAAATGRYPHTAPTPYTPLMNHSYAAVAAAASLNPSQSTPTLGGASATSSGAMALDDLDSASHTSGKSSMSKDFSFDPTSIKQEPEEFSSSSCGSGVGRSRQCRDEKKARELGVTFSIDDIINLPMDEFNDMLSRQELTEEQLNLCRDIRRRGKNKVAAQNCRKRKIDQIAQLEEEVHRARTRKQNLLMERETLFRQRDEWRSKLMGVEEDILSGMGRNTKEFRLDFGAPEVRILRRDELIVGRQPSDHLETNRYAQTGPSSSSDTSQHPNFNWKSDSNQHS